MAALDPGKGAYTGVTYYANVQGFCWLIILLSQSVFIITLLLFSNILIILLVTDLVHSNYGRPNFQLIVNISFSNLNFNIENVYSTIEK